MPDFDLTPIEGDPFASDPLVRLETLKTDLLHHELPAVGVQADQAPNTLAPNAQAPDARMQRFIQRISSHQPDDRMQRFIERIFASPQEAAQPQR